eukprot:CAMPEP_0116872456 /NCGR_PEP_ID=MMETSP0463-20121206/3214_1 /TAXON_ID=181622 /ORGANISM="Strombidinopsis sp, Strain SopsisLIS2011" /LENGTH=60 /DNA_ID=CAMNT_0004512711 /DNA_START=708 /DNA_END=890 /DNA_ORIENTATION=+
MAHSGTILIAQILGVIVQKVLTERKINLIGGILFIAFGVYELFANILLEIDAESQRSDSV